MPTTTQTITKEELLSAMKSGKIMQIVNVLSPDYYTLGMIKGSLRIPLAELDNRSSELDKDVEVVTYCASVSCPASREAAEKLSQKGFHVRAYEGGIKEWKEASLPTESTSIADELPAVDLGSGLSGLPNASRR